MFIVTSVNSKEKKEKKRGARVYAFHMNIAASVKMHAIVLEAEM